jgi:hypothetical protein
MNDELSKKQQLIKHIEDELQHSKLSRRGLLGRLKGVGIGFGAAFLLGIKESDAHSAPEAAASLKSTNPVLNNIIEAGPQAEQAEKGAEDRPIQTAQYFRGYRRFFRRFFRRF